jgi:hypothetical protein
VKYLALEDMERLAKEIGNNTDNSEDWADAAGFDGELLDQVGDVLTHMACERMEKLAHDSIRDSFASGFSSGMAVDIGGVIKEACLSSFVLGFETHKQFGRGADPRGE